MSEPWFILTKRFGADISDPTLNDLQTAVHEIVDPNYAEDHEHTSTFVRYGYDDGPMYVLTYATDRRLSFEQWKDQDFEVEAAPTGYISDVPPHRVVMLMQELREGAVDRVKQMEWITGR